MDSGLRFVVQVGLARVGANLYLCARFNAADVAAAIRRATITLLQGVPPNPTLKQEVEAMLGKQLHHGYGMTEYAGSLLVMRMDRQRTDCSAGEIFAGAELQVVGLDGKPVPEGEPGELWVRGSGVMGGYYRAPDLTAEALRPGQLAQHQ